VSIDAKLPVSLSVCKIKQLNTAQYIHTSRLENAKGFREKKCVSQNRMKKMGYLDSEVIGSSFIRLEH
jgi:hypothetical protein